MTDKRILVLILATLLVGCPSTSAIVVEEKGPATELNFLEPPQRNRPYDENPLEQGFGTRISNLDSEKELTLALYCRTTYQDEKLAYASGTVAAAVVTWVAGKLAKYIVDGAEKALAAKLAEYSAQYANNSQRYGLYRDVDNGVPTLASHCFRFTRSADKNITLDLIAQIRLDGDAISIRPLRLFVDRTLANSDRASDKQDSKKVTLSFSLKSSATWFHGQRGYKETVFDETIFSEDVLIDAKRNVTTIGSTDGKTKYYFDADKWKDLDVPSRLGDDDGSWLSLEKILVAWNEYPRLPLVPWSAIPNSSGRYGTASFTMTGTEVGLKPELLVAVQALLKDEKDSLTSALKNAMTSSLISDSESD